MKDAPDLSGYSISIFRGPDYVWTWSATDPGGRTVPHIRNDRGLHPSRKLAERGALQAIERDARRNAPMSGDELRERVRASDEAEQ